MEKVDSEIIPMPMAFPPYRRSHFRSHTYTTLLRILTHLSPSTVSTQQQQPLNVPGTFLFMFLLLLPFVLLLSVVLSSNDRDIVIIFIYMHDPGFEPRLPILPLRGEFLATRLLDKKKKLEIVRESSLHFLFCISSNHFY